MNTDLIKKALRILHLEDNETDRVFVREMLAADGLEAAIVAVKSREEFDQALHEGDYDLIISDYTLPSFDGMRAATMARQVRPEVPFIFFSGTIGEEVAIESLKIGAADYVLKQRPHRLVPAVRQAVRNAKERARRKQAENALRQSEERFSIVARASNDVIWEWDVESNTIWYSPNVEMVFGHSPASIGTRIEGWHELIHPADRPRYLEGIGRCFGARGKMWWSEHRVRRADGSYAYVFDRVSFIYDSNQKPSRLIGISIDVTERKQAELKIREQAELLNKARDGIILCDLESRIQFWNQGAERIYGWQAEEAIGRSISELLMHQERTEVAEIIKRVDQSGEWEGELQEFTKSGEPVTTQVSITLIRDEQNQPKSLLMINTDITERKVLEEQFLRAQRLESLGVLVSGIAHDLNNSLSPVLMGISMLAEQNQNPATGQILQMVETSARRGADMVKQVLTFARGGGAGKTVIHMEQLAQEMCKIASNVFPRNIDCQVRKEAGLWPVSGIPTQLHQVLMNLCVNARDAMPEGGTLVIDLKNVTLDAAAAAQIPEAKAGNYLCLAVSDTGTGMSPEQVNKLFQPFFTTKAPGKGTGLGLSTSRNIIRNHQGFMSVQSEPGRGTEFRCYLPANVVAPAEMAPTEETSLPSGHGERILVVDDEEATRAIVRTTLENYGFRVLTAASGPEAITLVDRDPNAFDLIVTDLSMPFMSGSETLGGLRRAAANVPIIAISGVEQTSAHFDATSAGAFIQKPFTAEQLLTAVKKVMKLP